jgi:hypothetical protein
MNGSTVAMLVGGAGLVLAGGAYYLGGDGSAGGPAGVQPAPAAARAEALPAPNPNLPVVQVWKSPTCGCCAGWVEHMRRAGFQVEVQDVADVTPYKAQHGISPELHSCHTSLVDGYAIEGHVPAEDIVRLLAERPQVSGIAAPGMPVGSPGMEAGNQRDRYDVLTFDREGRTTVWASHP